MQRLCSRRAHPDVGLFWRRQHYQRCHGMYRCNKRIRRRREKAISVVWWDRMAGLRPPTAEDRKSPLEGGDGAPIERPPVKSRTIREGGTHSITARIESALRLLLPDFHATPLGCTSRSMRTCYRGLPAHFSNAFGSAFCNLRKAVAVSITSQQRMIFPRLRVHIETQSQDGSVLVFDIVP